MSSHSSHSIRDTRWRRGDATAFLVPVAAGVAMWVYAGALRDPSAASEGRYLALLSTAVLAAIVGVLRSSGAPSRLPDLMAVAVAATVWVLPAGPTRGAVTTLLLATGLLGACVFSRSRGWRWPNLLSAAMGIQLLTQPGLLLPSPLAPRSLLALFLLPLVASVCTYRLGRRCGEAQGLLAGILVVTLGPGFTLLGVLGLASLTLGVELGQGGSPVRGVSRGWGGAVTLCVVLLLVWDPRLGVVLTLTGLAASGRGGRWATPWLALLLVVLFRVHSWEDVLGAVLWIPLVLPVRLLRWPPAEASLAGLVLVLLGAAVAPDLGAPAPHLGALIPGLGLLALTLVEGKDRPGLRLQGAWSGGLLVSVVVLAAYPWLRAHPLSHVVAMWAAGGAEPGTALLALLALASLLFCLVARLAMSWSAGSPSRATLLRLGALGTVVALWLALPHQRTVLIRWPQVVLSAEDPSWSLDLPVALDGGAPWESLVMDSALTHATVLPDGTPVATVGLFLADGRRLEWSVRAGDETDEWAFPVDRLVRAPASRPQPWLWWVHGFADPASPGAVLGRRYRSCLELPVPGVGERLEVVRTPTLPAEVDVTLFYLGGGSSCWGGGVKASLPRRFHGQS